MKNPKVQVLVHGKNISQASVSLNYPGVKLLKINKVENPNYLFLDLQIAATAKLGTVKVNFCKKMEKKLVKIFSAYCQKIKFRSKKEL